MRRKSFSRRDFLRGLAGGATLASSAPLSISTALAQNAPGNAAYPARPIRVIVPFAAGSSTDITMRRLEPHMTRALGQQLVIDNRPGAVGVLGSEQVKRAAPDGYTLLMTAVSSHSIAAALRPNSLPYDVIRDFTPIGRLLTTTNFIAVHPSVPARNLQELIAHSKTISGGLSFASGGTGSSNHLAGEALRLAGANIVHVPYNSAAQAVNEVIGGHIPVLIYTAAVVPHMRSGRLRVLAVTSERRHKHAPDVPTVVEQGMASVVSQGWTGLFGPAGLPAAIRNRLWAVLKDAMTDPDTRQKFADAGLEEALSPPDEFRAFLERDVVKWRDIVRRAGLSTT
jgi:tripartite-type tricarboxylate transporter receptor subunit TctC